MPETRVRRLPRGIGWRGGFSLLELLVAVAIFAILAGLGAGALPRERLQAREVSRILAADLNRARTEAIRLNANVAFAFNDPACNGYCVYADLPRSGSPNGDLDGDGDVDLAQPLLLDRDPSAEFPLASVAPDPLAPAKVWFDVRGLPRGSTGAFLGSTVTLAVRPNNGEPGYLVTLEPQGRVQVVGE